MNNNYFTNYFIAGIYILLLIMLRKSHKTWFAPSVFFVFVWTVYITLPMILTPYFFVSSQAILWILLACFATVAGFVCGHLMSRPLIKDNSKQWVFLSKKLLNRSTKRQIIFGSVSGIIAMLLSVSIDPKDLLDISNIEGLARENAIKRYTGEAEPPIISSIFLAFTYYSSIISGMYFSTLKINTTTKIDIYSYLPIVSLILMGTVQNTKASMLYGSILWISGFYTIIAFRYSGKVKIFTGKKIIVFSLVIFGVFNLFMWMQMSRYNFSENAYQDAIDNILVSAFGYLGGFSIWFDTQNFDDITELGFGSHSMKGITNLFTDSIQGERELYIPKYIGEGYKTNVDTIFSELILDFGIYGSIVFMSIIGLIYGIVYKYFMAASILSIAMMPIFYSVTIWGFTNSLLNYSSIVLAFVLVGVNMKALSYKSKKLNITFR